MLHRIAWELRPPSIDELGLSNAIENYVADWGKKHGINADFHCTDPELDRRSNEIRTTVYRVIQEGLTNVARHARDVTNVSVVIGVAEVHRTWPSKTTGAASIRRRRHRVSVCSARRAVAAGRRPAGH